MTDRGQCPFSPFCGSTVRLCRKCGQHVYWVRTHDGWVTPASYHSGTVTCRG